MNFTNPWGFLALLGIPVIVLLYILKQKFKTQEVGSMYLWNKVLEQSDGHRWRQKLKKNIIMFLQMAAVFLHAVALARPFISSFGERSNVVIVIDSSTSMTSSDEKPSRLEKAKHDAVELIDNSKDGTFFTVIEFDSAPYVLVTLIQEKENAKRAVNSIKSEYTGADKEALKAVLQSIEAKDTANVYLFTDKNYDLGIEDVNTVIYGNSQVNYAIKLVSQNASKVLVKVSAFGGGEKCNVALFADGVILNSEEIIFNGNKTADVVFNVEQDFKILTAKILDEDALSADNTYFFSGKDLTEKKAILVTKGNLFLEKSISVAGGVKLYKKDISEAENLSGYDLYIFDGVLPEIIPSDGHLWVINPPDENPFSSLSEALDIGNTWIEGETLNGNISKLEFAADKIRTTKTPSWAETVIGSDAGTLAIYGEKGGQKVCLFTFDVRDTQLPLLKEFPILVYNIINSFIPEGSAFNQFIFSGDTVEVDLLPKTVSAFLEAPSGNKINTDPIKGLKEVFNETGVYKLVQSFEDGMSEESFFAVNSVTEGESDLETGTDTEGNSSKGGIKTGRNLAPTIIFAALILLMIEWWVNWREN